MHTAEPGSGEKTDTLHFLPCLSSSNSDDELWPKQLFGNLWSVKVIGPWP